VNYFLLEPYEFVWSHRAGRIGRGLIVAVREFRRNAAFLHLGTSRQGQASEVPVTPRQCVFRLVLTRKLRKAAAEPAVST
jgi:hypothetical protein